MPSASRAVRLLREAQGTERYYCDYQDCSRCINPFFGKDHFRDHLRIYHREDVLRRPGGRGGDRTWWKTRAPCVMLGGWWRCSWCLVRVEQARHQFVCHACGRACETERK
ncbi:uncharacterized protein C8A04DRAFT_11853 [Dichotomopilus funicola]|uniref:C2H2-type domain-containing protein n=1 Tax=Dichotomopilus funicola TaxID=1934379 RepID=A0AAN6V363_9PEZI|nr:hypothetical protein C8A04DRAFT_11853 [Dichotomopilus funicola]